MEAAFDCSTFFPSRRVPHEVRIGRNGSVNTIRCMLSSIRDFDLSHNRHKRRQIKQDLSRGLGGSATKVLIAFAETAQILRRGQSDVEKMAQLKD